MMQDTFVWTEVFNCGEIGRIAMLSYLAHHNAVPVHVYGYAEDLAEIPDHPLVIKKSMRSGIWAQVQYLAWSKLGLGKPVLTESSLHKGFNRGHLGTARLWSYLIMTRSEKHMIHFDSDVIFLGSVVQDVLDRMNRGASLVGQVRCYKNNPNKRNDVRHLQDVTQTCCFGFDRNRVNPHSYGELVRMCLGSYNPKGHPIIDFFDPVMFEILGNGGQTDFLPHDEVGGCNLEGNRCNAYTKVNDYDTPFKIDFGSKLIHFSAVGSGINIYRNKSVRMAESYRQYALDRYALFAQTFFNKDIGVDLSGYEELIKYLRRINTTTWQYQA
ncbi:MAG TPA: hypothetical protein VK959_04645 [Methylophilaceae bacterium]|jgi:hypothetical protein|nr:hypothetical protein [Methylophilaceae bacterium]